MCTRLRHNAQLSLLRLRGTGPSVTFEFRNRAAVSTWILRRSGRFWTRVHSHRCRGALIRARQLWNYGFSYSSNPENADVENNMKKRIIIYAALVATVAVAVLFAQRTDIQSSILGAGGKPALAVVDFRGAGATQPFMAAFNSTL